MEEPSFSSWGVKMDRLMKRITAWSALALLVTAVCQWRMPRQWLLAVVITLVVVVYQLGMRLLVGNVVEEWFPQHFKVNSGWFKVRSWEVKFYQRLKVKQWKKHLPTYEPEKYDVRHYALTEIIQTMCCAELDHEIMFVLSYLPVILIIWFGDPAIFITTSIITSLIEVPFVVLQRFNRARLVKIAGRKGTKTNKTF